MDQPCTQNMVEISWDPAVGAHLDGGIVDAIDVLEDAILVLETTKAGLRWCCAHGPGKAATSAHKGTHE